MSAADVNSVDQTAENKDCLISHCCPCIFYNSGVLVTGAAGYLAIHCVQQLLRQGYKVRGTVRDLNRSDKIDPLRQLENTDRLELFRASLEDGVDLWEEAAENCTYVLHVASPCTVLPDEAMVDTAVTGTMNVLRGAARRQCVRKVVLTSSCGAINVKSNFHLRQHVREGHGDPKKVFTEEDWTNLNWRHLHP
ncbi:unnamed protein product, partial [Gongylonema pulchrum]|uniref:Epimerase domain-containing protein n=1 Tax=Gongylonema pulchrum TaxID=637853 RepID=A0A183EM25_9BILA